MHKENFFNHLITLIRNPRKLQMSIIMRLSRLHLITDELYLKYIFKASLGYKLDLKHPKTFNEKLNWLKLYYHNPILPILADKYKVKEIVAEKIGEEHVVRNYGVWDDFDSINFCNCPSKFVLKTTNDSLGPYIVRDISKFDIKGARRFLKKGLKRNYFWDWREWGYKDIEPRIIMDEYLDDHTGKQLRDYKFWCFNGVPQYMYCTIKGDDVYENFYDMNFQPVFWINHGFKRHEPEFDKPVCFEQMRKFAKELAGDLPFVRIDFFEVDRHVYFGEFTFYDWAGLHPFLTYEMDRKLGELLILPEPMV